MRHRYHPNWIRHIAPSRDTSLVAVGEFEKHVAVWDVASGDLVSSFETVLDSGGQRLALSHDGSRCIAAAYSRRGLACYDSRDGSILWDRFDLKRTQYVIPSSDSRHVYVCFDDRPCHVLSLETGQTTTTLRGVRGIWESPDGERRLLSKGRKPLEVVSGVTRLGQIQRETFAVLDACVAPRMLVLSESGGCVRCLEESLRLLWRYEPLVGSHVLSLGMCSSRQVFLAVEWPYVQGGMRSLLHLAPESGEARHITDLPNAWETGFCCAGDLLLTAGGMVVDTWTGDVVRSLPFPV